MHDDIVVEPIGQWTSIFSFCIFKTAPGGKVDLNDGTDGEYKASDGIEEEGGAVDRKTQTLPEELCEQA